MDLQKENTRQYSKKEIVDYYSTYSLRPDEKHFNFEGDVLIIGCGAGRTVIPLAENLQNNITAIDISPEMIKRCKEGLKKRNLKANVFVADASELQLDRKFDYIWFPFHSIDSIFPIKNRKKALKITRGMLKNGGQIVYNTHNRFFYKYFLKYLSSLTKPFIKDIVPHGYVYSYYANPFGEEGKRIWRNSINPKFPKWKKILSSILPIIFNKSVYIVIKNATK
ncbi:hypothetical protein COW82_01405 [Candidatus Campbellbacteria bacterium CG22_combo_CG10-13_8_21_14_all_43_18]|uniref:Methyltransferase domain-containing protein n=1 Tax=Candidatus Campbellbacteria bacterium CG22_combo_CG10-13_8_21_14_all_43_18 TaxID=1974530 RepID=A0A2H0DWL5_9BACT|nr:MAG: hypothetical protein COW82_01405 [Candidatus Campbellbacteria bacterium CG22_combo_CG10-13_8_21_14_all_43_18]